MKKLLILLVILISSVTMSKAQFYSTMEDATYAIIPYGTFINGNNFGVAIDVNYLGVYMDFGSERIEKGRYESLFMTFGLMAEPLPHMYLMAGLGSFNMYEDNQYIGYDFKLMYDVIPDDYNLVLTPMIEINSLEISYGIGVGYKLFDRRIF